jgi:hypothetical protein
MIKNVYWSTCNVPAILVRLYSNLNFLDRFSKIIQISNFVKILPVTADLFYSQAEIPDDLVTQMSGTVGVGICPWAPL